MVLGKMTRFAPLLFFMISGCVIQFDEVEDYLEQFPLNGSSSVLIEGVNGDVGIMGDPELEDTVTIRGTRSAIGATPDKAKDNLEHAKLEPSFHAARLELMYDPPVEYQDLVNLELDGVSDFPPFVDVECSVADGDLTAEGMAGAITLSTDDGDIVVDDIGMGPVKLETEDGNVDLTLSVDSFTISCYAEDGEVTLEHGDATKVVDSEDMVQYVRGDGEKIVEIRTENGDIALYLPGL